MLGSFAAAVSSVDPTVPVADVTGSGTYEVFFYEKSGLGQSIQVYTAVNGQMVPMISDAPPRGEVVSMAVTRTDPLFVFRVEFPQGTNRVSADFTLEGSRFTQRVTN